MTFVTGSVTSKWAKQSGGPSGDECQNIVSFHMLQDPITEVGVTPAVGRGGENGSANVGVANGEWVRRLTALECERLQGFPDHWTFGSDGARYAALGDAVTTTVARWLGQRLLTFS